MFVSTRTKRIDGQTYQTGVLVTNDERVIWECGHAHPVTLYSVTSSVAEDCARYERQKRSGGW